MDTTGITGTTGTHNTTTKAHNITYECLGRIVLNGMISVTSFVLTENCCRDYGTLIPFKPKYLNQILVHDIVISVAVDSLERFCLTILQAIYLWYGFVIVIIAGSMVPH